MGIDGHTGKGEQPLVRQVDGELAVGPARVVVAVIQQAIGLLLPGVEVPADPVDLAGHIGLVGPHPALTDLTGHRAARLGAGSGGLGDDVDHPALGGAPDRGARPLDDLDPLDDAQGDVREIGPPGHGRVEPNAVDQHQHMLLPAALNKDLGTAVEIRRGLAHREPGHPLQHLGQALGVDGRDFLVADDGDVLGHLGDGLSGAGGHGHHLRVVEVHGQGVGLGCLGDRGAAEQGGGQGGQSA
ncbi:MAG: hypothetical protein Q7W05_06210 [Deltaproteobacteria bacterium]|nr:hypothetical protein [Deltaproteobacteria bacterium]